jgi:hypothetical protein
MATNKRRIVRQQQGGPLSDSQMAVLQDGNDLFQEFPDLDARRRTYQQCRAEVLERHRETHGLFSRPYSWWQFDAKELRKRIGGTGTALDCDDWYTDTYWGKPRFYAEDYAIEDSPTYESAKDYLIRHKLLTAEEKRILARNGQEQPR